MPVVFEPRLTARAAELLTSTYAAHQSARPETTASILGQALDECGP